jgi:arylsulfatase A-like enzyme
MPSHVAMFTGALPRSLGLSRAPGGRGANCRPVIEANADRVLAEVLRRAGYRTSAVSSNAWVAPYAGFGTGFERFRDARGGRRRRIHDPSARARMRWALEAMRARVDDGAGVAERVVRGWLDEGPAQPFFWFVNLIECHSPYLPPRPYNDLGPFGRLRAADEARRYLTLHGILRACAGRFDIPAEALERMRHLYAREIRLMDDWLGRILEEMDRRGVLDDTVVIVTSDHGENLGEGNLIGHAFSLDDRLIHVPLVAAGPGIRPFDGVFSTTGIPRLIAEALGLEDHPWKSDAVAAGVGVAQYDAMSDVNDERVRGMRRDGQIDDAGVRRFTTPMSCATDGRHKLVRYGDEEWLFDLHADPLETAPVSPNGSANGSTARLRAALEEANASERAPAPDLGLGADEADDIEERMRLLGYL